MRLDEFLIEGLTAGGWLRRRWGKLSTVGEAKKTPEDGLGKRRNADVRACLVLMCVEQNWLWTVFLRDYSLVSNTVFPLFPFQSFLKPFKSSSNYG